MSKLPPYITILTILMLVYGFSLLFLSRTAFADEAPDGGKMTYEKLINMSLYAASEAPSNVSMTCEAIAAKHQGPIRRYLTIHYWDETSATPCSVTYFKPHEINGDEEVLWTALNEAGYCEAKSQELVSRLEDAGWDCGVRQ